MTTKEVVEMEGGRGRGYFRFGELHESYITLAIKKWLTLIRQLVPRHPLKLFFFCQLVTPGKLISNHSHGPWARQPRCPSPSEERGTCSQPCFHFSFVRQVYQGRRKGYSARSMYNNWLAGSLVQAHCIRLSRQALILVPFLSKLNTHLNCCIFCVFHY